MTFTRPPAGDDPDWPRASTWLSGDVRGRGAATATLPVVRVVGVPCSVGSISPSQAWRTPAVVRDALRRLSTWDPVTGVDLAHALAVEDLGDWPVADLALQTAVDEIARRASGLDVDAAVHVFLGGDNAITRPVVAGLLGPDLSDVGVITLDAHHDVRHLDEGPRNGSPIRGLVADGLRGRHVVQVGIGRFTNSRVHAGWCAAQGVHVIDVTTVHATGVDAIVARALAHLDGVSRIHVDLDIDVLDVVHAPACPGSRPGGLTPPQLFRAAELLGAEPRVRSVDLVEVDASADEGGRTVMATAMTLLHLAVGIASRDRPR